MLCFVLHIITYLQHCFHEINTNKADKINVLHCLLPCPVFCRMHTTELIFKLPGIGKQLNERSSGNCDTEIFIYCKSVSMIEYIDCAGILITGCIYCDCACIIVTGVAVNFNY